MRPPEARTKVLLVDDDEDDFLIVRTMFAKMHGSPFELEWVQDITEAGAAIHEARHDAYLIDYRLGADSGLELLATLGIQDRSQPFIILTGAGDRRIEQKAMDMGVADYLVKGAFDSELLSRVLRYSLQRKHLEAQRVRHLMEINRSKDEFISLASHQLRTPATVVKQYVAMVLDGYGGEVPEMQRTMLTKAFDSNELQLRIVNDLLHVAAIDAGRVHVQPTPLDARDIVGNTLQDLQSKLADRQQTVDYKEPAEAMMVMGDELKLRMVFDNIIGNASKYSDPRTKLRIRLKDADTFIRIAVSDKGVGIPKAERDKLFQKFSRIPNRLSTEVGGSGLGLYWAKQIVDLHGGDITVDSEAGKGSTFTVSLPKA